LAESVEELVVLPVAGTTHAHTGCFHAVCPLPGGTELWLFGGIPLPRLRDDRLAFQSGRMLAGLLRPAGVDTEVLQGRLEESGLLAGLAVEWIELPFPRMRRWFQFRVEPELVGELFRRLREFSSPATERSRAEPGAAADGGGM
jgi:hypothetical protein